MNNEKCEKTNLFSHLVFKKKLLAKKCEKANNTIVNRSNFMQDLF